jgi:hypothetical protein
MKGYLLSALLLLLSVVALHPAANAEDVRVSVPFEFSAAGRLMPAGTYVVTRLTATGPDKTLVITNTERGSRTFLLPMTFESWQFDQVSLRFERIGDLHVLSTVQTSSGLYILAHQPRAVKMASTPAATVQGGK